MTEDDLINGLIWHCECKALALSEIVKFAPPADPFGLRMYHSLYLTNLLSMTEMMADFFGPAFSRDLEESLCFDDHPDGAMNYAYLRELRNSVVHRGIDPTAAGTVFDGALYVLSPRSVTNRNGKQPYRPFAHTLRELFQRCEVRIGPTVQRHVATLPSYRAKADPVEAAKALMAAIATSEAPEWAKAMAVDNDIASKVPFEEVATARWDKLEALLLAEPPSSLFPFPNHEALT